MRPAYALAAIGLLFAAQACRSSEAPVAPAGGVGPPRATPGPEPAPAHEGGPRDGGAQESPFAFASGGPLNHVLCTGQSLSTGTAGRPILSTTQPFDNLMFSGGVRASNDGGLGAFAPLVEGGTETMSSAFAELVSGLAVRESPPRAHRVLVSCHGVGGIGYVGLKKGTRAYATGLEQVHAAMDLARAAGLPYAVRALTNVHGETDHSTNNTSYEQNLVDWQRDYEVDVHAITAQTDPIPMLHTQVSSWTKLGQATSIIPGQQLAASTKSGGKIVMVGPKYALAYAKDGIHLSSDGYRHMGEYYAKVYRQVIVDGKPWEPLRPIRATLAGREIRVTFLVPSPPLVLDTALVARAGNAYGFEYADDGAVPPEIESVTLDGPDAVKIRLTAAPTAPNKRVRYAFTGTPGAAGGPKTGPRGNLRDSDATPSRHDYPLYNWAVHFDLPLGP